MHALATELFPICRSITGDGVRRTLARLAQELPGLQVHEEPSGTSVLDWTVPSEWNITSARLTGPNGQTLIDFADSSIHVVSYSTPVDVRLPLTELQAHLHSDPEVRTAIPYVTSYYNPTWGFCLTQEQRDQLPAGEYHAFINTTLEPGSLTYADLTLPGETDDEILVTTYVCHPSLGNNELSGPMVATALARWVAGLQRRRYTYRFVFAPETIGAITYISRHGDHLRDHVVAGFNLTCIGDDGDYSYLPSRLGDTPVDRIARRVVMRTPQPVIYSYLDRGSDERQYCMPGIDLPLISLMRTKYGAYPQYHTSLDDLTVITPTGLQGGLDLVRDVITEFEASAYYRTTVVGEPQLGKRGLYHTMHARTVADVVLLRTHVLAYSDGVHSAADIAEMVEAPVSLVEEVLAELAEHGLVAPCPPRRSR